MTITAFKLGLAALALGTASAAYAGDSEDFAGCDGLKKPKRKDDGMRGEAAMSGWHNAALFGAPASKPAQTVAACDRALANPKLLPTQTLRRAHLLRARAAAQLELGKHAPALADLEQAETLVAAQANDPFFARSMGASLLLLRAVAKAGLGETDEAARLADQAAALRPYALQVQVAASAIRGAARTGDPALEQAQRLLRLEPGAATQLILGAHARGDFAAVRTLAPAGLANWADGSGEDDKPQPFVVRVDNAFLNALAATLAVGYAEAAEGDGAAARRRIEEARGRLALLSGGSDAGEQATKLLGERVVAPRVAQIEARLALEEQGAEAALAKISGDGLPVDAATLELFRAIAARAPEGMTVPDATAIAAEVGERRSADLGRIAPTVLIAPESARKVIDYKKSRPNILGALIGGALTMGTSLLGGIDRTTGFRSSQNPDGTLTVEYVGNTNSGPMVQEMTLLRAAELAREAGHERFAIVDRKDYQRFMATMQNGFETSRVPSGYKTELHVRFLGDEAPGPGTFDALAVIDDLGPLYYES